MAECQTATRCRSTFSTRLFATGTENDFQIAPAFPFDVSTQRYSAFIQDQWRIAPTLTANLGVRWDTESFHGLDPVTGPFEAFSLTNQWSPRIGVVWDFVGDGTSKLYASAGRFYYALPMDLNVLVYTGTSIVNTYNYNLDSVTQDDAAPQHQTFRGGNAAGEPIDPGMKASYQDELTIGIEKALDPTLLVGLKGTYRTLGRAIEDRCDLDTDDRLAGLVLRHLQPGRNRPRGVRPDPDLQPIGQSDGRHGGRVRPSRRRDRARQAHLPRHRADCPQAVQQHPLGAALVPVLLAPGQLLRCRPRGDRPDGSRHQRRLRLLPAPPECLRESRARPAAAGPNRCGVQRTLWPVGRNRFLRPKRNPRLADRLVQWRFVDSLYLDQRGSDGREATDYELNLSAGYNLSIGPVTITPMLYLYNVLNRQTVVNVDQLFNPNGNFVTNPASPFYGQAGFEPGTARPDGTICQSATPCTDNPDYLKASVRTNPRLLRAALKITF